MFLAGGWTGYVDKLKEGFSQIRPEDTVVLCGDLSWAMGLEEAREDFAFLNALPGKKLLMKGQSSTTGGIPPAKMERFFQENGFTTFHLLHNNCHFYGDIALCGTRGWFYEEDREGHGTKIFNRELIRLEASLKAGGEKEKFCFLHYPPLYQGYRCQEIIDLMERYGVTRCYYGHLHGGSHRLAASGKHGGIEYHLVSGGLFGVSTGKVGGRLKNSWKILKNPLVKQRDIW